MNAWRDLPASQTVFCRLLAHAALADDLVDASCTVLNVTTCIADLAP
jgi:hypothetical protein